MLNIDPQLNLDPQNRPEKKDAPPTMVDGGPGTLETEKLTQGMRDALSERLNELGGLRGQAAREAYEEVLTFATREDGGLSYNASQIVAEWTKEDRGHFEAVLLDALTSENRDVRWLAGWALAKSGLELEVNVSRFLTHVREKLDSTDDRFDFKAFMDDILGKLGIRSLPLVPDILRRATQHSFSTSGIDMEIMHLEGAIAKILKAAPEETMPILVQSLKDSDPKSQALIFKALDNAKVALPEQMIDLIGAQLDSPEAFVRGDALSAIQHVGTRAQKFLNRVLELAEEDENMVVRSDAYRAFGKIAPDGDAIPTLFTAWEQICDLTGVLTQPRPADIEKLSSAEVAKDAEQDEGLTTDPTLAEPKARTPTEEEGRMILEALSDPVIMEDLEASLMDVHPDPDDTTLTPDPRRCLHGILEGIAPHLGTDNRVALLLQKSLTAPAGFLRSYAKSALNHVTDFEAAKPFLRSILESGSNSIGSYFPVSNFGERGTELARQVIAELKARAEGATSKDERDMLTAKYGLLGRIISNWK